MSDNPQALCRLDVTDRTFLPVAGSMVGDAGTVLGLGLESASRLRTVTQELCSAIAAEGFPGSGPVAIQIAVERRPGTVAVVVTDQGSPSHLTRPGSQPPRLTELMQLGFADELSFVGEGRRGNRAELIKRLAYASVLESLAEAPDEAPTAEVGDDVAERIVYRPLEPADALEVARLVYRCYGRSAYQMEEVYEPDRLAELVRAGIHLGTVAEVDGRLIGHVASVIDRPGARVGLVGELVVDPAFRRFKVAGALGMQHAVRLISLGMIGQYSAAVTVHPASQKVALKFGGHEVAVLLAAQLPSLAFAGFEDRTRGRKSVIWFYNGIGKEESKVQYVPSGYHDIVLDIYANAGLPRTLGEPPRREPRDVPEQSTLDLELKSEARRAVVRVTAYGRDFLAALQSQLRELCLHRFDIINLELPMSDQLTSVYGVGLHELGFFFGGVRPEYVDEGDVLVLQYLNDVEVDADEIQTASDFGTELRDFVLADWQRTLRSAAERQRSRAQLARIYESLS